jgi:hypothetical protein
MQIEIREPIPGPIPDVDEFDLDLRVGYGEITDSPDVAIYASGSCGKTCSCPSPCSCQTCFTCTCTQEPCNYANTCAGGCTGANVCSGDGDDDW